MASKAAVARCEKDPGDKGHLFSLPFLAVTPQASPVPTLSSVVCGGPFPFRFSASQFCPHAMEKSKEFFRPCRHCELPMWLGAFDNKPVYSPNPPPRTWKAAINRFFFLLLRSTQPTSFNPSTPFTPSPLVRDVLVAKSLYDPRILDFPCAPFPSFLPSLFVLTGHLLRS